MQTVDTTMPTKAGFFAADKIDQRRLAVQMEIAQENEEVRGRQNAELFATFGADCANLLDASATAVEIQRHFREYRTTVIKHLFFRAITLRSSRHGATTVGVARAAFISLALVNAAVLGGLNADPGTRLIMSAIRVALVAAAAFVGIQVVMTGGLVLMIQQAFNKA